MQNNAPRSRASYEATLAELAMELPRVEQALRKAHDSRTRHLQNYFEGARLKGAEQLLSALDAVIKELPADSPIGVLLVRARADFEVCLETLLAGLLACAVDAMRDVMEIELLLLDFTATPDNAERWLKANNNERWNRFRPGSIRRRLASWGRIPAETTDYQAHSAALHPSPTRGPFVTRGVRRDADEPFGVDAAFWEMFEHARRLLRAIGPYLAIVGRPELQPMVALDGLDAVRDAWERTQQMQGIFLALLRAAAGNGETAPADGDDGLAN